MPRHGKFYRKEFKLKGFKLVVGENQSSTNVARTLDIPISSLNHWVKAWRDSQDDVFTGSEKKAISPERQETKELKARIKLLEVDIEILKRRTPFAR